MIYKIKPDQNCLICDGTGASTIFISIQTGEILGITCRCIVEQLPEEYSDDDEIVIDYISDEVDPERGDDSNSRLILKDGPEYEAEEDL